MRAGIIRFLLIVQGILFFGHWLLYITWTSFWRIDDPATRLGLAIGLGLLSVSFATATLAASRSGGLVTRFFYKCAAVWLGFLNFLFWASILCWIIYGAGLLFGVRADQAAIAFALFGLAVLVSLYGLVNAEWIRRTQITVRLPGLPPSWNGRLAALVSDVHLGHVHGPRFLSRIIRILRRKNPEVVFLTGDLFDGTEVDREAMVEPWKEYAPPLGSYFVTGNHEEFLDSSGYLAAIRKTGIRILHNEKIDLDGVELVGIFDRDLAHLTTQLATVGIEPERPSILLAHRPHHSPDGLSIAERAGIHLQLSGHTHGGQMPPFRSVARRVFREYTYGFHPFGSMDVYTTTGVGTWGPPMRVGTKPEIVFLRFEPVINSGSGDSNSASSSESGIRKAG